jgi:hypothetical protein
MDDLDVDVPAAQAVGQVKCTADICRDKQSWRWLGELRQDIGTQPFRGFRLRQHVGAGGTAAVRYERQQAYAGNSFKELARCRFAAGDVALATGAEPGNRLLQGAEWQ